MPLPGFIKNIFTGGATELIGKVGEVVDNLTLSKEEKETLKIKLIEATNSHTEKMAALAQAQTDSYLKDMDSARQMQIEALKNQDVFSKRFIYYLTLGLVLVALIFDYCFFFVSYPERNHDTLTMIAGVINTGCLMSIVNFYYGSSKSSHDKQALIDTARKKE